MNTGEAAGARVRVLFFAPSLGGGGAEKHLVRVANHLDRARFQPAVAVARGGGSYERELTEEIPLHRLGRGHVFRAVGALRRLVRTERPDLVCSFMDHANCAAIAATLGLRGTGVVAGVQTVPSISLRHGFSPHNRLVLGLLPHLYPRAAHLVALSEGVRHDLSRLVPSMKGRTTVIPNAGLDETVERLAGAAAPAPPAAPTGPVVMACGRLTAVKAFDSLLRAFARLRQHLPAQLWIVGEGELRAALEEEAARLQVTEAVWFTGFQQNPYALMRAADLFVLSSLWEGFGNVIVEAMAVGTPVVSADCPYGPGEIIHHEQDGLLVPPRDEAALAEAMLRVLSESELRSRLVAGGRSRAQDFTAPAVARGYAELFEKVVRARGDAAAGRATVTANGS